MTDYQYLSLSYFNGSEDRKPLVLRNNRGTSILQQNANYHVCVTKFYIDNSLIPIFIPVINPNPITIQPNLTGLPPLGNYVVLPQTSLATDLFCSIVYETATPNTNIFVSSVKWIPQNLNIPQPINNSRQSIITDPYYHCYNSIHLMKLISNAFNAIATTLNLFTPTESYFEFVKTTAGYNFLFDGQFNSFNVSFHLSPKLADMFGFLYTDSVVFKNWRQIVVNYDFIETYNNYYYISELNRPTNTIFPFTKLIMTSPDIIVQPLDYYISGQTDTAAEVQNPQLAIVTDFDLNISDPDAFYNNLSYTTATYDRKIVVENNRNTTYTINCMCLTPDGYTYAIDIKPNGYSNVYLAFIEDL